MKKMFINNLKGKGLNQQAKTYMPLITYD